MSKDIYLKDTYQFSILTCEDCWEEGKRELAEKKIIFDRYRSSGISSELANELMIRWHMRHR